jgi:hypothetical protein
MEQRMNRSDEFYRKRIAQLEPELRRSELGPDVRRGLQPTRVGPRELGTTTLRSAAQR